jgi:hypothetical protein
LRFRREIEFCDLRLEFAVLREQHIDRPWRRKLVVGHEAQLRVAGRYGIRLACSITLLMSETVSFSAKMVLAA